MAAPANGFSLYLFYSGSSFLISCFLVFNGCRGFQHYCHQGRPFYLIAIKWMMHVIGVLLGSCASYV